MKLVTKHGNVHYLESLRQRLEENGIPAVIHGTETARMIVPTIVFEPSLWVFLNEQHEDAVNLVNDPHHTVTTGIDVDTFYAQQPSEAEQNAQLINLVGSITVVILIGVFAVFLFTNVFGGK